MTSELKPCGQGEFEKIAKSLEILKSACDKLSEGENNALADILEACSEIMEDNTRAVPDVPELARYRPATYMEPCLGGMFSDKSGEYVRYDQAVTVIAAKDGIIEKQECIVEKLERKLRHWIERAEAAEDKLAQSEKPIGYVSKSFFESLKIDRFHSIAAYVLRESSERYSEPLYTAPVASDVDLRAENGRYKQALEQIAKGEDTIYDEDVGTDVTTWMDEEDMQLVAVEALNPPEAGE